MNCQDCDIEFDPKKKKSKKGKITQCDECSAEDSTIRAIGYNDGSLNKSQNIAVFHGASEAVRKRLQGGRMV